jgi:hypothetical protein
MSTLRWSRPGPHRECAGLGARDRSKDILPGNKELFLFIDEKNR